jgi:hypothetical protein
MIRGPYLGYDCISQPRAREAVQAAAGGGLLLLLVVVLVVLLLVVVVLAAAGLDRRHTTHR